MSKPDIKTKNLKLIPTYLWSAECFACGTNNPCGLHMKFYYDGCKYLTSSLRLKEKFKGWDQLIHGGVISVIFDELMAWTIIYITKNIMLTKSITTNYYSKVVTNTKVEAFAWIEEIKSKEAILKSELYDDKDNLCAQASGVYAIFPLKLAKKLHLMSEESVIKFKNFFSACQ
jgi:acyl-coenzyme A thioesterase PaaI-like protein